MSITSKRRYQTQRGADKASVFHFVFLIILPLSLSLVSEYGHDHCQISFGWLSALCLPSFPSPCLCRIFYFCLGDFMPAFIHHSFSWSITPTVSYGLPGPFQTSPPADLCCQCKLQCMNTDQQGEEGWMMFIDRQRLIGTEGLCLKLTHTYENKYNLTIFQSCLNTHSFFLTIKFWKQIFCSFSKTAFDGPISLIRSFPKYFNLAVLLAGCILNIKESDNKRTTDHMSMTVGASDWLISTQSNFC